MKKKGQGGSGFAGAETVRTRTDHTRRRGPRARAPIFRRTCRPCSAREGRTGGRCAGPCRSWAGTTHRWARAPRGASLRKEDGIKISTLLGGEREKAHQCHGRGHSSSRPPSRARRPARRFPRASSLGGLSRAAQIRASGSSGAWGHKRECAAPRVVTGAGGTAAGQDVQWVDARSRAHAGRGVDSGERACGRKVRARLVCRQRPRVRGGHRWGSWRGSGRRWRPGGASRPARARTSASASGGRLCARACESAGGRGCARVRGCSGAGEVGRGGHGSEGGWGERVGGEIVSRRKSGGRGSAVGDRSVGRGRVSTGRQGDVGRKDGRRRYSGHCDAAWWVAQGRLRRRRAGGRGRGRGSAEGERQRRQQRKGLLKATTRSGAACCEGGGVLRVTRSRGRGRGVILLVMVLVLEGGVVGGRG